MIMFISQLLNLMHVLLQSQSQVEFDESYNRCIKSWVPWIPFAWWCFYGASCISLFRWWDPFVPVLWLPTPPSPLAVLALSFIWAGLIQSKLTKLLGPDDGQGGGNKGTYGAWVKRLFTGSCTFYMNALVIGGLAIFLPNYLYVRGTLVDTGVPDVI